MRNLKINNFYLFKSSKILTQDTIILPLNISQKLLSRISHSCFLWSHTGSCTHPSLGRPQGWLSRCRASAIWGLETTAEPSMSSNCCSISLRCSWNTTSKSPSSLLGCICREGDGWAYQVRPFVAPASTTGKLQPQCLSISVFPGCGGIPILQMGRLTTSRASEAFV